jgi:hypothetical protein
MAERVKRAATELRSVGTSVGTAVVHA